MMKEYLIVPAVDCCVHHAEGDGGGECGGGVGTRRTWHDVLTCPTVEVIVERDGDREANGEAICKAGAGVGQRLRRGVQYGSCHMR